MIIFQINHPDFTLYHRKRIRDWLLHMAHEYNCNISQLIYNFVTDETLFKLNSEYLQHQTLTDIITFDYTSNRQLCGEIFISIDQVRENAIHYKVHFYEELLRVMIHGILHMMGFCDKKRDEKMLMREHENRCIQAYYRMFHVEHAKNKKQ